MITRTMLAHERLLAALPVRTHLAPEMRHGSGGARPQSVKGAVQRKPGMAVLFGRGGIARPIRIGRTVYPSVTAAARTRKHSPRTIYEWLRSGQAAYVKETI